MVSSGSDSKSGDVELNLAPIIDCFTVLITYLLLSASFINLGMLEVVVPQDAKDAEPVKTTLVGDAPPQIKLSLHQNNSMDLSNETSERVIGRIEAQAETGGWDLLTLNAELEKLKLQFPKLDTLVIAAADEIDYKRLVMVIESSKKVLTQAALSAENTGLK